MEAGAVAEKSYLTWRKLWEKSHARSRNGGSLGYNSPEVTRPHVSVGWWYTESLGEGKGQ